jgi:uncharacterized damage-inducible protein DinB
LIVISYRLNLETVFLFESSGRHDRDMITLRDALTELEQEATATGRLLDRLPTDRLSWRPHPRSMTLGQLALHVATIPRSYAARIGSGRTEVAELVAHPDCDSIAEIRAAWTATTAFVRDAPRGDAAPDAAWSLTRDGSPILTLPAAAARRTLLLNHWVHHLGQLTVYLRLLDVPIPSIYGPSADEDPFA